MAMIPSTQCFPFCLQFECIDFFSGITKEVFQIIMHHCLYLLIMFKPANLACNCVVSYLYLCLQVERFIEELTFYFACFSILQ